MAIPIKSPRDIDAMRRAGVLLWRILGEAVASARAGMTTAALDAAIAGRIAAAGATPAFPGEGFPGAASITINEEAVHAPPGPRILRKGDVVTIDTALILDGWCVDGARAMLVGPGKAESQRLVAGARTAVDAAVAAIGPGRRWSGVAREAMGAAQAAGCFLVAEYAGHGIGRRLKEPPAAAFPRDGGGNLGSAGQDFVLRPGMVLTVEPVLVLGHPEVLGLDDGWTVVTADRSAAAHEERTVAVTGAGALVLTAP